MSEPTGAQEIYLKQERWSLQLMTGLWALLLASAVGMMFGENRLGWFLGMIVLNLLLLLLLRVFALAPRGERKSRRLELWGILFLALVSVALYCVGGEGAFQRRPHLDGLLYFWIFACAAYRDGQERRAALRAQEPLQR